MWSDRIRANDAGRGGWGDQWSQGSTHGVRAVQGSQGHPTTRRHTRDLNPRRNPTPCAQCQNRQRSGWRSRENAQGRRARHCLTRRWPWCTRTRTRTLSFGAVVRWRLVPTPASAPRPAATGGRGCASHVPRPLWGFVRRSGARALAAALTEWTKMGCSPHLSQLRFPIFPEVENFPHSSLHNRNKTQNHVRPHRRKNGHLFTL